MQQTALLNITEAAELFGVDRSTITRKIKDNSISDTQIVRHGREVKIYVNELIRVFGEPKRSINKHKQGNTATCDIMRENAVSAENASYLDPRDAHIATLLEQLEQGHQRERELKERADRYEREASEQRHVTEALRQKLLETSKPAERWGFFARVFGR